MYVSQLMSLPEPQKRAWLDGDFDALAGQFFTDFRPSGPLHGEPPEANHVIKPAVLPQWWHRWIGMDWGYQHNSAVYWGCLNPNGQVHVYRELVRSQVGTEQMGALIAQSSLGDLEALESHHMTLYLSPEIFGKRNDEKTFAEQIQWGIESVLGPGSCILLGPGETGNEDFFERREFQRGASITLRSAQNQRVAGWQYMRELMRFRPVYQGAQAEFDYAYGCKLAIEEGSFERYYEYLKAFDNRNKKAEVLPKLQIHSDCRQLIDAIPLAMYDETNGEDVQKKHFEGLDSLDGCRYLLMGLQREMKREPYQDFHQRRMESIRERHGEGVDGNMMVWANRKAEADYAKQFESPGHIFLSRASSRRAKLN
jgi:hypothetical protein